MCCPGEAKRFGPLSKVDVSRCLLPPEAVVAVRAAAEAAGVRHPIGGNCPREELLNGLTHGLGIIFAFFGGLMMMRRANATNDMATVLGCGVFCIAMNALYLISTLYHGAVLFGLSLKLPPRVFQALTARLLALDVVAANAYGVALVVFSGVARSAPRFAPPLTLLLVGARAKRTSRPVTFAWCHGLWHIFSAYVMFWTLYDE